jgi:hypothetical protein
MKPLSDILAQLRVLADALAHQDLATVETLMALFAEQLDAGRLDRTLSALRNRSHVQHEKKPEITKVLPVRTNGVEA